MLRKGIYTFAVAAFLVVGYSNLSAQTASELGLLLRGRLSEARAIYKPGQISWTGKLLMEFENKGNKPVILINPTLTYGTGLSKIEIYFTGQDKDGKPTTNSLGFTKSYDPTPDQSDALRSLVNLLDSERPDDNLTIVVAPGSTYQFEQPLEVVQKCSRQLVRDQYFGDLKKLVWEGSTHWYQDRHDVGLPVGLAERLIATYEYPITFLSDSPELLDRVNHRWRSYGRIPLDQSGVYKIASAPIEIVKGAFEKVDWPADSRTGLIFHKYSF